MKHDPTISDAQRTSFMQRLGGSDVILSDWEKRFYASWSTAHLADWYSDGRKKSVEAMWRKYGAMINHPFPGDLVTAVKIPDADPDGCEYFVKLDSVQQHCNAPAAFVNRNNFRYCSEHAEQVQKDLKRLGGAMALQRFQPKANI